MRNACEGLAMRDVTLSETVKDQVFKGIEARIVKVSTGVKGLDEMLDGGFPKGRVILLCGGPGTGKTIFSLQFLASAAEKGKPGVYVTLEEPLDLIRESVEAFSWNLKEKETNNLLRLLDFYTVPYGDSFELRNRNDEEPIL